MLSGSGWRNCRSGCKRSCPTARTRVRVPKGLLLDRTSKAFSAQTGPPRPFPRKLGPPRLFLRKLGLKGFLCSNWASRSFYAQTGPPRLFLLKLGLQGFLCSNWASRSFYAQTGPPGLFMLKLGLQVFLCSNWASKSFYAQTPLSCGRHSLSVSKLWLFWDQLPTFVHRVAICQFFEVYLGNRCLFTDQCVKG